MKTIVSVRFGSHLYGTSTPDSDTDFKSVFFPTGRQIVMQDAVCRSTLSRSTKKDTTRKNDADDVDDELFSLIKFMNMLKVGDMIASEILFAPISSLTLCTPEWEHIVANRHRLLNKQIRGFVGYCQKQAAKYGIKGSRVAAIRAALNLLNNIVGHEMKPASAMKLGTFSDLVEDFCKVQEHSEIVEIEQPSGLMLKHWEVCGRKMPYTISVQEAQNILTKVFDNYGHRALAAETNQGVDWKAVSHAIRVGEQAIELVDTGIITFPRPNAEDLLNIKLGKVAYKEVAERLESLLEEVEKASVASSLPEHPDLKFMEDLVYQFYKKQVNEEK